MIEVDEFSLWVAGSQRRLVEVKKRAADLFSSGEVPSEEIQRALEESSLAVNELGAELLGLALNVLGSKILGTDVKRLEEQILKIRVKTDEHIDKLSALVSGLAHLS